MNKHNLLGAAISTILLSAFAHTASAYTYDFTTSTTVTPAKFAAELPTTTTKLSIPGFQLKIPTPPTDVTSSAPFYVKLVLTGATKFVEAPVVKCKASGAGDITLNPQLGAGTNTMVYQLNPPSVSPNKYRLKTTGYCNVSAVGSVAGGGTGNLAMTSLTSASISAIIQYTEAGDSKNNSYQGALISFNNGLSPTYSASNAKVVVDVSQASQKFTTAGSIGSVATVKGIYTAYLGTVGFSNVGSVSALRAVGNGNISVGSAIQSMQLTISGPLLGAINTTGKIWLHSTATLANLCKASASFGTSKRASGTTVSFVLTGDSAFASLSQNKVSVCLSVNGKTALDKGQITVDLKATATNGFRPTVAGGTPNLVFVAKNGASKKALNIPFPENADDPFIRINNMTTGTGKIFITLYGEDGAVIGTSGVPLSAPLTSMQTVILNAESIAALVGVTTWGRRAWMQIESELADISVQNLVRSSNVLTNMSDGVTGIK